MFGVLGLFGFLLVGMFGCSDFILHVSALALWTSGSLCTYPVSLLVRVYTSMHHDHLHTSQHICTSMLCLHVDIDV